MIILKILILTITVYLNGLSLTWHWLLKEGYYLENTQTSKHASIAKSTVTARLRRFPKIKDHGEFIP